MTALNCSYHGRGDYVRITGVSSEPQLSTLIELAKSTDSRFAQRNLSRDFYVTTNTDEFHAAFCKEFS